jgi:hypothetical protein
MNRIVLAIQGMTMIMMIGACDRKGDLGTPDDRPMPVGTRTQGEGPNPDTKGNSPRMQNGTGGSGSGNGGSGGTAQPLR